MADHLLVQISDIHLTLDGPLSPYSRPRHNLMAALAALEESGLRPDVLILTGDLANAGDPACYQDLAGIMDDASSRLGSLVVYLPGNHDLRPAFRRHLLGQPDTPGPVNQVHWHGGLRIVSLDTSVPGEEAGLLTDETVAFLRTALADPAPDGTVVAVHHPPVASPIRPMARIMLRNPGELAAAIEGRDVRLVIAGHNHHGTAGTLGRTPVWVSPASAYRLDVLSPAANRGVPGCAISRIDVDGAGTTVTVIEVPVPTGS
jgi:3',5'-cyclic AMP phosphodiesterase CpdA